MPPNLRRSPSTATPPARDPHDYRDVAASAQHLVEQAVFALTDTLVARTGVPVLHIAGGVGFNASLNGKLLDHPAVRSLFVQPLAGDAGVAIGAAAAVAADDGDTMTPLTTSIGWGAEFSPAAIRRTLTDAGVAFTEPADIAAATAELIAADGVVGWFQGRSEAGPRALGHRSILANPANRDTRDRVNLRMKRREWWRPLAPSMTAESAGRYVDAGVELPYMIVTRPLRESMRSRLAAVDHEDGTTRPQTVAAADEPLYHRLLDRLGEETGVSLTVNTSFNGNEEPVVWTPAEALRTHESLGLDALAVGPFLVTRR
jgi:carbamoyltransferase